MVETLEVCPDAKVPNVCQREGCTNPARRKYCSEACKQAAFYARRPDVLWKRARRNAWVNMRNAYKSLSFDGVHSGTRNEAAGRLRDFGLREDGTPRDTDDLLREDAVLRQQAKR